MPCRCDQRERQIRDKLKVDLRRQRLLAVLKHDPDIRLPPLDKLDNLLDPDQHPELQPDLRVLRRERPDRGREMRRGEIRRGGDRQLRRQLQLPRGKE